MKNEHVEIEKKLKDLFDENFDILKSESGHTIAEYTKQLAWNQVLYYWKKLYEIAQHITDSEVRLCLPNQKTKKKRTFSIDGVVDIIREHSETWMYDIKTHDAEYIEGNKKFYENQLNIYAHIWQKLRNSKLDHTAIISTSFSKALRTAIRDGDPIRIAKALQEWNPIIEMHFSKEGVGHTVEDFGNVVDEIEENKFSPPSVSKLSEKYPGSDKTFLNRICSNCDTRFTCPSFRQYITNATKGTHTKFKKYVDVAIDEIEREEWVNVNLEALEE